MQLSVEFLKKLNTFFFNYLLQGTGLITALLKVSSWLVYGYPGAASFRSSMYQLLTVDELVHNARIFFERVDHFPKPQFKSSESFMMSGHG